MRIKQKIWLGLGASVVASAAVACVIALILADIRRDMAMNDLYVKIINESSALSYLSSNVQERPTARVIRQLQSIRSSLSRILDVITPSDMRENFLIRHLRKNYADLWTLLDRQIFFQERAPGGGAPEGRLQQGAAATHIRIKARAITDDATRLVALNQSRIIAAQQRANVLVLVFFGAVALVNVALAYVASGSLVRGVLRLNEGVKRLARGSLDHRLPVRGADELAELTTNFNEMAASLQASHDRLIDHARQLEQTNRELQDFAHVASHDLQEPLRKIRTFADRLRLESGPSLNDASLDFLARMERAAGRMQDLIDALLTYSRLAARPQAARRTDLGEALRGVLEDLEERVTATDAFLDVGELPAIHADPIQMRQLFQNLISNALKYHRPDVPPRIRVRGRLITEDNGREICEIIVTDNGIGFDERFLGKIFTPFQRLHGKKRFEGMGIGLAICRRIAERHDGTITAASEPGRGSSFIVLLPAKPGSHSLARAEPAAGQPRKDEAT